MPASAAQQAAYKRYYDKKTQDPAWRAAETERLRKWREEHLERAREINRESMRRARARAREGASDLKQEMPVSTL